MIKQQFMNLVLEIKGNIYTTLKIRYKLYTYILCIFRYKGNQRRITSCQIGFKNFSDVQK